MTLKLLVSGGEGQVGREFAALSRPGIDIVSCSRKQLDICNPDSIAEMLDHEMPDAVINAAAYTAVDKAESEPERAFAINSEGAGHLARAAQARGIALLHISTDYVFSGDKTPADSYREDDACAPKSVYGSSKLAGEQQVLNHCERAMVLRTSWVFGRHGNNFPKTMLRLARERDEIRVVADQWGCPTHARDIANTLVTCAQALCAGEASTGVYHYAGAPACTWHDLACVVIDKAFTRGLISRKPRLIPISTHEYPVAAPRPANSILCCEKLLSRVNTGLSDWQRGLDVLLHELSATSI